mgnify:CR=1 FL=1
MKKLLAMVLALVMTLSLAVSANAAFKDADKVSADYSEAVAVLNGMGVFKGYEDGSFQPQGNITRAEVAAIVYRVYTADVKDAKASMYATYNKFGSGLHRLLRQRCARQGLSQRHLPALRQGHGL